MQALGSFGKRGLVSTAEEGSRSGWWSDSRDGLHPDTVGCCQGSRRGGLAGEQERAMHVAGRPQRRAN